jgi:hypothetical protein
MLLHYTIFLFLTFNALVFGNTGTTQHVALDLEKTTWHYTDNGNDETTGYDITFSKEGILTTTHPNDRTPNNDFWQQKGDSVFFQYNDQYSRYRGRIIHPGLIEGVAANDYSSWDWKLERFIQDPS